MLPINQRDVKLLLQLDFHAPLPPIHPAHTAIPQPSLATLPLPLQSELEDLCFAVLQPAEYRRLRRELDALWGVPTIPPQVLGCLVLLACKLLLFPGLQAVCLRPPCTQPARKLAATHRRCWPAGPSHLSSTPARLQAIPSMDAVLEEECECTIDDSGTLHLTTKPSTAGTAGAAAEADALRERRRSHAAASTSGGGGESGGGSSSSSDGGRIEFGWLTPQQREVSGGGAVVGHLHCCCSREVVPPWQQATLPGGRQAARRLAPPPASSYCLAVPCSAVARGRAPAQHAPFTPASSRGLLAATQACKTVPFGST